MLDLASDGRVVHGFLNCSRISDQEEEQPRNLDANANILLIQSASFAKSSRSVGATDFYISHLSKQIQNKSLSIPAAFTMFNGYGDMSCLHSLGSSFQILAD